MQSTVHIPPHRLTSQVADELAWSPDVCADQIDVTAQGAVVTLSGEVDTLQEKAAAVRAGLRVRGVSEVVDLLSVGSAPTSRPDDEMSRDAAAALALIGCQASSVQVGVVDHVITLTGVVPWQFQRTGAEDAVHAIPGAVGVVNAITLAPTRPFSALQSAALVTAALRRSAAVDSDNVHVSTTGSTVELFGHVSSATQRDEAGQAAWSVPGVTHVANNLRVLDFGILG